MDYLIPAVQIILGGLSSAVVFYAGFREGKKR